MYEFADFSETKYTNYYLCGFGSISEYTTTQNLFSLNEARASTLCTTEIHSISWQFSCQSLIESLYRLLELQLFCGISERE